MFKVSPSGISYLMECPKCLWLYANEKIERPRGIFPSLPSGMDEVFKKYFDEYRQKNDLPPEIKGKINAKLFSDTPKLNLWRNIDFGRGGLKAEFPEFDILLAGAIDELLVDSANNFIIFDFKTRGYKINKDSHKHYQHQLDLYSLLFEKNGFKVTTSGYLLFFWPEKYANNKAIFTTQLVELNISPSRGMDILKKVEQIIKSKKPPIHGNCEYCNYREFDRQLF